MERVIVTLCFVSDKDVIQPVTLFKTVLLEHKDAAIRTATPGYHYVETVWKGSY